MGLILMQRKLESTPVKLIEDGNASNVYIIVERKLLSNPYELQPSTYLHGLILDIRSIDLENQKKYGGDYKKIADYFRKTAFGFYLYKNVTGNYDWLFLSSDSWRMIRDYGILPEEFLISVKITTAQVENIWIEIYPNRDVFGE